MRLWWLVLTGIFASPAQSAQHICAPCHPKETARYLASAMGQSIGPPGAIAAGRLAHSASGSSLGAEMRSGRMVHTLSERGVRAEYPVAYQIGRGMKARTYAVRVGAYLLESPLSWFRTGGWDVSPGYEAMPVLDFDRPLTENCLFCHANRARATDADGRRIPDSAVSAIDCERCHGSPAEHLRRPSAANIVNPAKLTGPARDAVCEQCHLEGATRVVNPGRTQWDYRPGQLLENTMVNYLLEAEPGKPDRHAVNQVQELAQSTCVRASSGKLWCGTCHSPHGVATNRPAQLTRICTSCHASLSQTTHAASKTSDCAACHMPARPTSNIAHLAVTDHRLSARPQTSNPELRPWRPSPPQFQQRNDALAGLQLASERNLPALAAQSIKLLDTIPAAQQNNDPDVLSALQVLLLGTSTPEKAIALSRWAVESAPNSATFALNYGMALLRAGSTSEAERQLLRALDLDPSLMQAAAQLAVLYDRQDRKAESRKVIDRFLAWNPRNIQFRLAH